MSKIVLSILLLTLCSTATAVSIRYITDVMYVNLRSGPGSEYSAYIPLKSGTTLEIISDRAVNSYLYVKSSDGHEGWIPAKYLQQEPIARDAINIAKQETQTTQNTNKVLQEKLSQAEKDIIAARLTAAKFKSYENENQELKQQNLIAQKQLNLYEKNNSNFAAKEYRTWFLIGSGTVLFGILIGMLIPKLQSNSRNIFR